MINIGFIGAGGIAKAHAYALNALKFYYSDTPAFNLVSVTSAREASRQNFADHYGFDVAEDLSSFCQNGAIDTVFILGPNQVHYEHFKKALNMPNIKRIYLEKPVCGSHEEEKAMKSMLDILPAEVMVQVGFQYMQTSAVREAYAFWKTGVLGKPIHFDLKYYHGDYLHASYREKRKTRLTPAPEGGAMADLGSHGISLLMAFFGEDLQIKSAIQAGHFDDVPGDSDLFSSIALFDPHTRAVGHLSASRISSGTGDLIHLEIHAEKGALRYSSHQPDYFEYFLESENRWIRQSVGSHFKPITSFPSGHVPGGWLRALVHAHYMFLTGDHRGSFFPDLSHGLSVQRIVRETAGFLRAFNG